MFDKLCYISHVAIGLIVVLWLRNTTKSHNFRWSRESTKLKITSNDWIISFIKIPCIYFFSPGHITPGFIVAIVGRSLGLLIKNFSVGAELLNAQVLLEEKSYLIQIQVASLAEFLIILKMVDINYDIQMKQNKCLHIAYNLSRKDSVYTWKFLRL